MVLNAIGIAAFFVVKIGTMALGGNFYLTLFHLTKRNSVIGRVYSLQDGQDNKTKDYYSFRRTIYRE